MKKKLLKLNVETVKVLTSKESATVMGGSGPTSDGLTTTG